MSASIAFSNIASNARVPLFHFQLDATHANPGQNNPRTLVIGIPNTSLASAPLYVPSPAAAANLFGASSQLAAACIAAAAANPAGELWALPVFVPSGATSASGSIAFSGTATQAATLGVYVAGVPIDVPIAAGATAVMIADAVATAVYAAYSSSAWPALPAYPAVSGSTVTFTPVIVGTLGNQIDLRLNWGGLMAGESLPAGVSATITAMNGGAGLPVLTGIAAAIGTMEFDTIIHPFTDTTSLATLAAILNDMSGRWSDVQQIFGHLWSAQVATSAALLTWGATQNNQHSTVFGLYDSPTPPWVIGAAAAGAAAQSLAANPAQPLQTLVLPGVLASPVQSQFSPATNQALLTSGVATLQSNRDGSVSIQRAVTTYQSNAWGQADQSYLDTETLYTLMYVIRDLRNFVTTQFPRAMLADDGTRAGPGSNVVTPKTLRAALVNRYAVLEQTNLVERTDLFAQGLIVQRNVLDPSRVDVLYDPYLMSGLRIFAALVQFRLQAASS